MAPRGWGWGWGWGGVRVRVRVKIMILHLQPLTGIMDLRLFEVGGVIQGFL